VWNLLGDGPLTTAPQAPGEVTFPLSYVTPDEGALGWQERALCAQTDPEAFFPEKGGSTREAKRVCASCDVRGECLDYALAHDERFGIWGGLSERERRKLKRRAV
jgi:WhiB family redox-sensing transcriptional regulator